MSLLTIQHVLFCCVAFFSLDSSGAQRHETTTPIWLFHSQRDQITNPEERSTFAEILGENDTSKRAIQLEAFLGRYPTSPACEEALESLLDSYDQVGATEKVIATANRILSYYPNNLLALVAKAQSYRRTAAVNALSLEEQSELAKRGLVALHKVGATYSAHDEALARQKTVISAMFNEVIGSIALKMNDFEAAKLYLRTSVEEDSDVLGAAYQLSLAYFLSAPPNPQQGLFFLARAQILSPVGARNKIDAYGKAQSTKYFDSDHEWRRMKDLAKIYPVPPVSMTTTNRKN